MQIRDLMWPLEAIPVFRPDTPLSLALSSMCSAARKLGVGVVIGEHRKVVGILGGEFIGRLVEHGASPDLSDPVERHMQRPFATVSGHASLDRAAQLFREYEIEMIPVHDEQEEFVGLISRQDVLKAS